MKKLLTIIIVIFFLYVVTPYPNSLGVDIKKNITSSKENVICAENLDSVKDIAMRNAGNITAKKKRLLDSEEKKNKILQKLRKEIELAEMQLKEEEELAKDNLNEAN